MNVFTIKYLYEIYPDIDFTEEFVICQTVTKIGSEYHSEATSQAWSHVFDSIHNKRHIQTTVKDKYEVKFVLARNIDINRMQVAYTSLTTTEGETFIIYDVEVTEEKVSGTLEYYYTLTFYKNSDEIINHLSSDNVLSYKTGMSASVNELQYTVNNPGFVFNNIGVRSRYEGVSNYTVYTEYDYDDDSLFNFLEDGEYYYAHTNNPDFDIEEDFNGNKPSIVYITQTEVSGQKHIWIDWFATKKTTQITYILNQVTFNHIPDYRADEYTNDWDGNVTDKTITNTIYTFINPNIFNIRTPQDGITTADGIEENQSINSKYKASFKVWVKTSQLYLIEYLDYALFDDITLTLADGTEYLPVQVKDISKPVENDKLIDLHEFDINILYNNQTTNIFR